MVFSTFSVFSKTDSAKEDAEEQTDPNNGQDNNSPVFTRVRPLYRYTFVD